MQPPIPTGTLLQKRYRVTKILGQGGFGRTYLAQDTACFDELCVLKEFTPNDRSKEILKKSKELFQREAQVLYQINHPQIPKFRANFEELKRLFLVQEYAEGKTYANILSDRLKEGHAFTESEVIEFMQQMLPILAHIHSKGIIHRDISPDNIIQRKSDGLPVLIDFGVVKAGVGNLEFSEDVHQGTTVGKAGYAPNEQLQAGEAYANSDLYALAVTSVVMLTGRKPESLMDKKTMTWRWQQWVPNSNPWFIKILNRMLNRRPNDRFQLATEVAQALRSYGELPPSTNTAENQPLKNNTRSSVPISRVPSPKVSNYLKNANTFTDDNNVNHDISLTNLLKTPWGMAIAGGGIAILVLIIPLMLMMRSLEPSSNKNPNQKVTPPPTQIVSSPPTPDGTVPDPTPSPDPQPTPTNTPVPLNEPLTVEVGKTVIKEGQLVTNQIVSYILSLEEGQKLNATLSQGNVSLSILAPNRVPIDFKAQQVNNWQGKIPQTGEYFIEITPLGGVDETRYKLDVLVE
jgi:serine/threonine-protein kinase